MCVMWPQSGWILVTDWIVAEATTDFMWIIFLVHWKKLPVYVFLGHAQSKAFHTLFASSVFITTILFHAT